MEVNSQRNVGEYKEATEWQLAQLFKLQAELTTYTKQALVKWFEVSDKDATTQEGSAVSIDVYRRMWIEAWEGSKALVLGCSSEMQGDVNWLLDKRAALRRELEEYASKDMPEMRASLARYAPQAFQESDALWCEAWNASMGIVSIDVGKTCKLMLGVPSPETGGTN